MFIKDRYLLTASHTFEVKGTQEITVNIKLNEVPPCYHTLLTGRVLCKKKPINNAVVKVFDCKYNPLFHTVTDSRGVYRFLNVLTPGIYKVIATADGYKTSNTTRVKIKRNKVIKMSFRLKKCPNFMKGIVYGKVREVESNKPIEGAIVYLVNDCGIMYKTITNKDGQYIIYNIPPMKYKLITKKHGYIPSCPIELFVDKMDCIMLYVDLKKQYDRYNRTISGIVTSDNTPIPGTSVFLYLIDSEGKESLVKVQITNDEGAFLFSNLAEGNYIIKGKLQTGKLFERTVKFGIISKNHECHDN